MKIPLLTICFALSVILVNGCASSDTYVPVGKKYPRIKPSQVKIYHHPPAQYEEVARIPSDGESCISEPLPGFFGTNAASSAVWYHKEYLTSQAAKVGANGILLINDPSDFARGSISDGEFRASAPGATTTNTVYRIRYAAGMAIYVTQE